MALSLIIFDFDGVILESAEIKTRALFQIGKEFGSEIADWLVMYHRAHGGVSRFKKFEWLYNEFVGRPITEEEKEELNDKFTRAAMEEIMRCPLVPGAEDVLRNWKGRVPMYVASGAPSDELLFVLETRGLDHYFDGIYGSPPVKRELLRLVLQKAAVNPADAIMIGDSSTDQYAAEAVNIRFYGRGEYFRHSGYPWHEDLTKLDAHLEALHAEN